MKLPTVDLFTVCYPRDYPWLPYLWDSIYKHVSGLRRVVLVLERQDPVPPRLPDFVDVAVRRCRNYRGTDIEGYWGQSIECLRAHQYTDADLIWYHEADWMFVRDMDLQRDRDYSARRPLVLYNDWNKVGIARRWRQPTSKILEPLAVPAETMRRPPFFFPRWFIRDLWQQFGRKRLFDLVRAGLPISQFNVMGAAALALNRANGGKLFTEIHQANERKKIPRPCVVHFWKLRDPNNPAAQRELRKLGLRGAR